MTGIDPSHVDLQHLANDHSTTRATGETSYFSGLPNSFHLVAVSPRRCKRSSL